MSLWLARGCRHERRGGIWAEVPVSSCTGRGLKAQAALWPTAAKLWTQPYWTRGGRHSTPQRGTEAREVESCSHSERMLSHPFALSMFLSLLGIFFNLATLERHNFYSFSLSSCSPSLSAFFGQMSTAEAPQRPCPAEMQEAPGPILFTLAL